MADIANIANTPILLHGVGKGVLKTVSGKVLSITTAQSMQINVTSSTEDVYGGDGLFPLYTYLTQKEGTIEIQQAEFKLSQVAIAQGTETSATGNKRLRQMYITKETTTLGTGLTNVEVTALIAPNGDNVPTATEAGDDVVSVSATGAVAFGDNITQEGEYEIYFMAADEQSFKAKMLKDAMPEVASFNWMFQTVDSAGNKYQVDIFARRVRANGEFSIDTGRDTASTPTLNVKILDPGDGMDDFATITVTKLA